MRENSRYRKWLKFAVRERVEKKRNLQRTGDRWLNRCGPSNAGAKVNERQKKVKVQSEPRRGGFSRFPLKWRGIFKIKRGKKKSLRGDVGRLRDGLGGWKGDKGA